MLDDINNVIEFIPKMPRFYKRSDSELSSASGDEYASCSDEGIPFYLLTFIKMRVNKEYQNSLKKYDNEYSDGVSITIN